MLPYKVVVTSDGTQVLLPPRLKDGWGKNWEPAKIGRRIQMEIKLAIALLPGAIAGLNTHSLEQNNRFNATSSHAKSSQFKHLIGEYTLGYFH